MPRLTGVGPSRCRSEGTALHALTGYLDFAPDQREQTVAALKAVAARSRQDQGCVDYWWSEDLEQPGRFRFFECWESEEAFAAHQAQPYEHQFMTDHVSRIVGADAHVLDIAARAPSAAPSPMRGVRSTEDGIRVLTTDGDPDAGVRVSVASSGICGSDLHLVSFGPSTVTLGHEFCGRLDDGTPVAVLPVVRCGRCDTAWPAASSSARRPSGPCTGSASTAAWPTRCGWTRPAPRCFRPGSPSSRPAWSSHWPWPSTAATGPAWSPGPGCWSSGPDPSGCAPSPRPAPSGPTSTWWPTTPTGWRRASAWGPAPPSARSTTSCSTPPAPRDRWTGPSTWCGRAGPSASSAPSGSRSAFGIPFQLKEVTLVPAFTYGHHHGVSEFEQAAWLLAEHAGSGRDGHHPPLRPR